MHLAQISRISIHIVMMMMIPFITFNSSLVPLIEGLWISILWEFEWGSMKFQQ